MYEEMEKRGNPHLPQAQQALNYLFGGKILIEYTAKGQRQKIREWGGEKRPASTASIAGTYLSVTNIGKNAQMPKVPRYLNPVNCSLRRRFFQLLSLVLLNVNARKSMYV